MRSSAMMIWAMVLLMSLSSGLAAFVVQERSTRQQKAKPVKRAKRPQFSERDWDGVYFEDLFKDGLVGSRPQQIAPGKKPASLSTATAGDSSESEPNEFAWSTYIDGSTIENEVKALQMRLNQDVTTPVKFKSDYAKVHHSFSILSMMFAVVREYDGDVRWKKHSGAAQASFERAAANSRVGTIQAYESCKRRKGDLQEMIRGGNFAGTEKPPETLDWSVVVGRNPLMERLESAVDSLKTQTSNKGEFTNNLDAVLHEAQMVTAIAQALMRENMEGADDDGYLDYAKAMSKAGKSIADACGTGDYTSAAESVNLVGQSCSNCHDEWR